MTDKSHLLRFGYAPGNYWFVCNDCGNKRAEGDKRSTRCEACAETLYSQVASVEAVSDKHRGTPMTIPDEAVQAAYSAYVKFIEEGGSVPVTAALRAALTAALPFLTGVKVKALEWITTQNGTWIRAEGAGTVYEILASDPERETKIAAAQADYEDRILSAIEVSPSPRAQALEEALQKEKSLSDRLASALEYIDDYCLSYPDLGTISAVAQPALKAHSDVRALSSQPVADHIADAGKMVADGCKAYVGEMKTSSGTDYFVMIKSGDRELSIRKHQWKHHADYEAAEYNWVLNGGEKPDILAYRPLPTSPEVSG